MSMGFVSTIAALGLVLLGTPLFIVIAASGLLFLFRSGIDYSALIIELYKLAHTPNLAALPLFALAGYVLAESKAPHRLVRLSNALLGWLPGGLAIIALLASAVFTALTGATGLTIIALRSGFSFPPAFRSSFTGLWLRRVLIGSLWQVFFRVHYWFCFFPFTVGGKASVLTWRVPVSRFASSEER